MSRGICIIIANERSGLPFKDCFWASLFLFILPLFGGPFEQGGLRKCEVENIFGLKLGLHVGIRYRIPSRKREPRMIVLSVSLFPSRLHDYESRRTVIRICPYVRSFACRSFSSNLKHIPFSRFRRQKSGTGFRRLRYFCHV